MLFMNYARSFLLVHLSALSSNNDDKVACLLTLWIFILLWTCSQKKKKLWCAFNECLATCSYGNSWILLRWKPSLRHLLCGSCSKLAKWKLPLLCNVTRALGCLLETRRRRFHVIMLCRCWCQCRPGDATSHRRGWSVSWLRIDRVTLALKHR